MDGLVVDPVEADALAVLWCVDDPARADVEADVLDIAVVEDQVARAQAAAADPVHGAGRGAGVVRQVDAGGPPGRRGEARAVVAAGARTAPLVGLSELRVREPDR